MFQLRRIAPVALALFLPAIFPAVQATAQTATPLAPEVTARIDAAAKKELAATGVPSASVAVVRHGQIVYVHAYGKARLDPPLAATPAMQYSIGSVSKQFTAAAMLLMQEQGKLKLDDPVSKYLPELTRANEVTLRMLLSHTSGYQDFWPEDYVMTSMQAPTTAQHILDVWGRKPLDFDPGTRWQYSNTNYVIAGRIVELVSGQKLMDLLAVRVFKPLGMTGVLNQDAARLPSTDPIGYYRHALGPLRPSPLEGFGWMFAAGELAMPARDLALWNISLMERSLLQPASYDEMFREVKLKDGKGTGYGLGVEIGDRNGHRVISHSGEVSGFVSMNTVYPDDKAAVTVLTNEDASSAAGAIAKDLDGILLAPVGAPGDAKTEARALAIFTGLQNGQLDRSQLTPYCDAYFSPEAITDFASSLKPLGTPTEFKQVNEEQRGGMTFRVFHAKFPKRTVVVTTYEMPDGKLEQYLVIPTTS
ncbi:MAG: serine hydrolase domain-containing protein [Acidobacteriaceae bacterium]